MIVKHKQFFKQIEKKERMRGSLTVKFPNFGQGRNYTGCLTHRTANCNTVDIFNQKISIWIYVYKYMYHQNYTIQSFD